MEYTWQIWILQFVCAAPTQDGQSSKHGLPSWVRITGISYQLSPCCAEVLQYVVEITMNYDGNYLNN